MSGRFSVTVRGKASEWIVYVDEAQATAMREDGFDVHEVINTIPEWVVDVGMAAPWAMAQDLFDWPSRMWRRWTKKDTA